MSDLSFAVDDERPLVPLGAHLADDHEHARLSGGLQSGMIERMNGVQIVRVDERDNNWETPLPRFRVYLHGSGEDATNGSTDTYDVTGADVLQVIDWAQRQAGGVLTYAIALVYDDQTREALNPGCGRGLIWLVGMDGNDTARTDRQADAQQRMLTRRRTPVQIGVADHMPAGVPDPYNDGTETR